MTFPYIEHLPVNFGLNRSLNYLNLDQTKINHGVIIHPRCYKPGIPFAGINVFNFFYLSCRYNNVVGRAIWVSPLKESYRMF
jgi:hypothetical protein